MIMKTIIIFNIMTTTTIATTFIIATIIATIAITTIDQPDHQEETCRQGRGSGDPDGDGGPATKVIVVS